MVHICNNPGNPISQPGKFFGTPISETRDWDMILVFWHHIPKLRSSDAVSGQ